MHKVDVRALRRRGRALALEQRLRLLPGLAAAAGARKPQPHPRWRRQRPARPRRAGTRWNAASAGACTGGAGHASGEQGACHERRPHLPADRRAHLAAADVVVVEVDAAQQAAVACAAPQPRHRLAARESSRLPRRLSCGGHGAHAQPQPRAPSGACTSCSVCCSTLRPRTGLDGHLAEGGPGERDGHRRRGAGLHQAGAGGHGGVEAGVVGAREAAQHLHGPGRRRRVWWGAARAGTPRARRPGSGAA